MMLTLDQTRDQFSPRWQSMAGVGNLEVCTIEKKKCILSISVDEVVAAARRARDRNLTMARR